MSKIPPIQYDKVSDDKEYLGDGLYVRRRGDTIWVTAEDGVEVLEKIAFDPSVLFVFEEYVKMLRARAFKEFDGVKEHVEVPAPQQVKASEQWLRNFIEVSDCPSYETVIGKIISDQTTKPWDTDGEYLHFDAIDAHGSIPPEFWDHVEIVTGKKIEKKVKYFSCSC